MKTKFRDDTSFPFLKIASDHNVPYGKVLRAVDVLEQGRCPDPDVMFLAPTILDAMDAELLRRAEAASPSLP